MDVSELRKNAKLEIDGHPFVVVEFNFVKPGKGQGLYKCKLKNLISGAVFDRTYRSGEKLIAANVESNKMQFLFATAEVFTFMDCDTYEQVEVPVRVVGDDKNWLLDNLECDVLFHNERPVGISLPSHVVMEITECEPGVKGDTATNVTKQAVVSTGGTLNVPLFIKQGDKVKVDTRTGSYVERVNS
ncbi:MAG: elongation factor P [Nannocystaceae bacterium]|nr:elongation factor P [Nannocystaceae bacterium]